MALSNAERQRRHRERLKEKLAAIETEPEGSLTLRLTVLRNAERIAVMLDSLYPVPDRKQWPDMPTFLGWNRYEWSEAPEQLVDFLGMKEAWLRWKSEKDNLQRLSDEVRRRQDARVNEIVAEHGKDVCDRAMQGYGTLRLLDEYRKDPTLSKFKSGRKRVT